MQVIGRELVESCIMSTLTSEAQLLTKPSSKCVRVSRQNYQRNDTRMDVWHRCHKATCGSVCVTRVILRASGGVVWRGVRLGRRGVLRWGFKLSGCPT